MGVHDDPQCKHSVYTVPFFALLGAACGVVGALFNYLNIHVVGGLRKKYNKTWHKVLVVFVMCIITSMTFVLVPFAGKCQEATINTMYDRYDPTYGGMGRSFCPHTEWDKEIADLQRNSSVKEMSWLNVSLMEEVGYKTYIVASSSRTNPNPTPPHRRCLANRPSTRRLSCNSTAMKDRITRSRRSSFSPPRRPSRCCSSRASPGSSPLRLCSFRSFCTFAWPS